MTTEKNTRGHLYNQEMENTLRNLIIERNSTLKSVSVNKRLNDLSRDKGFEDYEEYLDVLAMGLGFTCFEEYKKVWMYYPGMHNPNSINRNSTHSFIGYITECGISRIFENVQKMPHANRGYDFICGKGQKIEVKGATLDPRNFFGFHIRHNKVADYMILVGFDDIIKLNPLHIWMIKKDEIIQDIPLNDRSALYVYNDKESIKHLDKYELFEKLERLKSVCVEYNRRSLDNVPTKAQILEAISKLKFAGKSKVNRSDILEILKENNGTKNRFRAVPASECNR